MGEIGKNTLLTNKALGNIIQIGAVLVDTALEPDNPVEYRLTGFARAIAGLYQNLSGKSSWRRYGGSEALRTLLNARNEKGFVLKHCWLCRKACPNHAGAGPGI